MSAAFAEELQRCRTAQRLWAELPIAQRLRPVRELRHQLAEQWSTLCQAIESDIGRPPREVVTTDVLPTADACWFLEKEAARLLRPRRVPKRLRPYWLIQEQSTIYHRPHGVVGIIGTWNYPLFLNGVQIVQALTAGNGVLWKPSEVAPKFAEVMTQLLRQAGFPTDLVQTLPATRDAGPLLAEADVDHVVFTGSADVGRKLAQRLGERLISSTLELSGCDALFVLDDADVTLAAHAAGFGLMLNQGQTCLAVRRVFVHQSVADEFRGCLSDLLQRVETRPLALVGQVQQAERLVEDARRLGAQVERQKSTTEASDRCFAPTILWGATPQMAICHEACFAPLVAVLTFCDLEEAVQLHRSSDYGLGASIFTRDRRRGQALAERLETGVVLINDVLVATAHPATPFGGRHASGWGVTQGAEGLLAMTVPQVVSQRAGTFRPHYDAIFGPDPATERMILGLLRYAHGRGWWARLRGLRDLFAGMLAFGKTKSAPEPAAASESKNRPDGT